MKNLLCGVIMLSAVSAGAEGVAMFDSFSYEGNDEYYNTHPLEDESSFYNPVLPGWYSDPSVCTNGRGDYFLVTSTFTYFPGVPIFHSRDLVNWKQAGHVLDRLSQLKRLDRQPVSGGIFAPDIAYNPADSTYYMITTNVGSGNFFVKTRNPFGEWSDPVMLREIKGIDPSIFFDDDGRCYVVHNDNAPDDRPEYSGHCTIRVAEIDTNSGHIIGGERIVVNKGSRPDENPIWCEGPHLYKINGLYYLMTAEGGTGQQHSEVIYRGASPFGPFMPWDGNPILTQRNLDDGRENPVTCAGHADLVQAAEGDWWSVFLACRPVNDGKENLGRETFMMPVKWTDDGWPFMTRDGDTVPLQLRRDGSVRLENATNGNFSLTDGFDEDRLEHDWMTLRGNAADYYSLTENPGFLTMKCVPVRSTETAVLPYVGRRIQHHQFTAMTDMIFRQSSPEECAGMMMLKDETHQYQFVVTGGASQRVELRKVGGDGYEVIAVRGLDGSPGDVVHLRIEGNGLELTFSYSTDSGRLWHDVAAGVDAGYTSTAVAGGFTGTTIGIYASGAEY